VISRIGARSAIGTSSADGRDDFLAATMRRVLHAPCRFQRAQPDVRDRLKTSRIARIVRSRDEEFLAGWSE